MKNLIISIFLIAGSNASDAAPSHDDIARCFWIYAPMHELAKEMQLVQLQSFTLGRVGWLGGYLQANINNQQFKYSFENDLKNKKSQGIAMKESMRDAIVSMNEKKYEEIISKAIECDKIIGIKTEFIPPIGW